MGEEGLKSRVLAHTDFSLQYSSYWQALLQLNHFRSVFRPVYRWHPEGRFHSYPSLRIHCCFLKFPGAPCLFLPSRLPWSPPYLSLFFPSPSEKKRKQNNKAGPSGVSGYGSHPCFWLRIQEILSCCSEWNSLKRPAKPQIAGWEGPKEWQLYTWRLQDPPLFTDDGKGNIGGRAAPEPSYHRTLMAAELHLLIAV